MTDPVTIAQALVRCESVTPHEGGALSVLESILKPAGFAVQRPVFSDPGTPDVENLFATIGTGSPHLMFAGHTDVVPAGDPQSWSYPPFDAHIADGVLYGRGAEDMKGGIAAFCAAALGFLADKSNRFSGTLSLLITGDEEGPAINGTQKLLAWAAEAGHRFDAAIVGEPTNPESLGDAIKVGRRGSLSGTLAVVGKQGHVAYPARAVNPIHALHRLLDPLITRPLDQGNDRFEPSNLEVISIDVGNPAWNVVPEQAEARFNIRFNDTWTAQTLRDYLESTVAEAADGSVRYRLTFQPAVSHCFLTRDDALIGQMSDAVEAVTGRRPDLSTGGGTSDARFIKDYCPVVEFGLVGRTMHQVDERVPVADIEVLTGVYRRFLGSYFGSQAERAA